MSTERPKAELTLSFGRVHQATLPRHRLQLTTAERKAMLLLIDMLLINGSLLTAVTIWNEFPISFLATVSNFKWFVTLSVVWLSFAVILDVYDLARASSTTTIVGGIGLTTLIAGLLYTFIPWLTPPILSRSYVLWLLAHQYGDCDHLACHIRTGAGSAGISPARLHSRNGRHRPRPAA
jgi:hypothetical protein